MQQKGQLRAIEEMKVPRKGRCGILECVHNFEVKLFVTFIPLHLTVHSLKMFANKAEVIASEVNRRLELDTNYKLLIKAVFEAIERIALSHYKTPPHVIRFGMYVHCNNDMPYWVYVYSMYSSSYMP